jgi:CHAT domain-containing protein
MIRDRDEDCISNKELHDMMKAMTKLFTKNQASNTTTSPSTISYCILPSLPSYDGFDSNKYFAWEIEMHEIFGQCRICERRKLENVASALMNNALAWWKHLCESNELPKTWKDVENLMRKTFVDSSSASNLNFEIHSLEQPTIVSPIVHNILQKVEIKQEKEQK